MSGTNNLKNLYESIYTEGASFEIGSGHRAAQKQAKIANLAAKTTNPGEAAAAKAKLKGPKLPKINEAKKEKTLRNTNPCWKGYEPIGTKKKNGRTVPNCVPKEEFELDERHMTAAEKAKEERLGKKTKESALPAMKKRYGEKKGEQVYYAWKRKQAMAEEAYEYVIETLIDSEFAKDFESAEIMLEHISDEFVDVILEEYIEEKARGTRKKSTLHAYDVDETLFSHGKKGKPNVKVHVNDASGKRVKSLSNQEFNTHKLEKGHSYDFSEFQSAKKFKETSSPNKKVIKHLQKQVKRGENVHLITARSKFDNPKEFHGHLKKHGVDVPLKNIHYTGGMKGGDIGDKKVKVANAIAKQSKTKNIHMYDDAAKVHKSFEKEKQEHPTTKKIKTHLIKPNKSGEPTSRSYQATKEEMTAYDFWKQFIPENTDV